MVRRLSAKEIAGLDIPGKYGDGDGLQLRIDTAGGTVRRRWIYRYTFRDKRREMGLGGFPDINLSRARELRDKAKLDLRSGLDPLVSRKANHGVPAFGAFADEVRKSLETGFRNDKHKAQWKSTLETYCAKIWTTPVDVVDTDHVLDILRPIWTTKSETASRLRGRIETVLDAAKASGHRSGENPARWRGHLEFLLAKRLKLSRGHHKSMPIDAVPAFMNSLQKQEGLAARALELCVLTALRTNSLLGGLWSEVDLETCIWRVPGRRMKGGMDYEVPLSQDAMAIIRDLHAIRINDFMFFGQRKDRPLSNMAMSMLLRRMKVTNATVHGFRSTFRDWAGDETDHEREVAEGSLSHRIGNQAEQAYRRQSALRKRRQLLEDWAAYCRSGLATNSTSHSFIQQNLVIKTNENAAELTVVKIPFT